MSVQFQTEPDTIIQIQIFMNQHPFVQQAIPMIAVDEHTGKYVLTKQADNFFRAIQGPIAVVSVAGLYRTGKSYLLNRVLLNRSNGFGVGPTVQACTKGLWCWGTPLKGTSNEDQPINIVVIDTEGIGALDQDQTHDTKIFTLAILASSVFIYNSVGTIDENAIQNLSLVVNLTKNIQLRGQQNEQGIDPDEVSTYFPSFFWVVRDFSLQLQDPQGNPISTKEYLEQALAPQKGFTDDIEEKNRIRRLLTAFFKERECVTMVRPLVEEDQLQNLDKMELQKLRPEFAYQAINFRKSIMSGIKPKCLQNKALTGNMYLSMMNSYVSAINEGAVPNIENAWNYMCEQQCRKALSDCYELCFNEIKEAFSNYNDFPTSEENFTMRVNQAKERALQTFREKALGDKTSGVLKELKHSINEKIHEIKSENIEASVEKLKKYLKDKVAFIAKKIQSSQYKHNSQLVEDIDKMKEHLLRQAPKYHTYERVYLEGMLKLLQQGSNFTYNNLKKEMKKNTDSYVLKEQDMQNTIKTLRDQKDQLSKELQQVKIESDRKIIELTSKISVLTDNLSQTMAAKQQEQKQMEREFTARHGELENNRKKLQQRMQELKSEMGEKERQLMEGLKNWEKEKAILQLKLSQQQSRVEEMMKRQKSQIGEVSKQRQEMSEKFKETISRHENEKSSLRNKLQETQEKLEQTTEALNRTQSEMNEAQARHEVSSLKLKEQLNKHKKELSQVKNSMEALRSESSSNLLSKESSLKSEFDRKEAELVESIRGLKENLERLKSNKVESEKEHQILVSRFNYLQQERDQLLLKISNMEDSHQRARSIYEKQMVEQNQTSLTQFMQDKERQIEQQTNQIKTKYEQEIKVRDLSIASLSQQLKNLKDSQYNLTLQLKLRESELTEEIASLQSRSKQLEASLKRGEEEQEDNLKKKEKSLNEAYEKLQKEYQEYKQKAMSELQDSNRQTQAKLEQIKLLAEMEKEALKKKLQKEKSAHEKKVSEMQIEFEDRYEQETSRLANENEELFEKLTNNEQLYKNTVTQMQFEINALSKEREGQLEHIRELKDTLGKREVQFKRQLELEVQAQRQEKEKMETKIDKITNDHNEKERELLNVGHQLLQANNALDKKDNRINELQKENEQNKSSIQQQRNKLEQRIVQLQKAKYAIEAKFETDTATLRQKVEFDAKEISSLEAAMANALREHESRITHIKEQRDREYREAVDKLTNEKNSLDSKYKEQKAILKEQEVTSKKTIQELSNENIVYQQKLINAQHKAREADDKHQRETNRITDELQRVRLALSQNQNSYKEQLIGWQNRNNSVQTKLKELEAELDKSKAISHFKITHLEQTKRQEAEDNLKKIRDLEERLIRCADENNSNKNGFEHNKTELVRQMESKHQQKLKEFQEQLTSTKRELQGRLAQKEKENKELNEKYHRQKLERTSSEKDYEKKLAEVTQAKNTLGSDFDKMKKAKQEIEERLSIQAINREQHLKEKIANLEGKLKNSSKKEKDLLFDIEREKFRWSTMVEELNTKLKEKEEQLARSEKEKERMKGKIEGSKREPNKTRTTHSYITGMKTQYDKPKPKAQDSNKENSQNQETIITLEE